jgi:hypothetical protein
MPSPTHLHLPPTLDSFLLEASLQPFIKNTSSSPLFLHKSHPSSISQRTQHRDNFLQGSPKSPFSSTQQKKKKICLRTGGFPGGRFQPPADDPLHASPPLTSYALFPSPAAVALMMEDFVSKVLLLLSRASISLLNFLFVFFFLCFCFGPEASEDARSSSIKKKKNCSGFEAVTRKISPLLPTLQFLACGNV